MRWMWRRGIIICSVLGHISDQTEAILYAFALTPMPYLQTNDVVFTIMTSLSSLPPRYVSDDGQ